MSAAIRRPPSLAARVGMVIGTVIVFVVVGPPLGLLTFLFFPSPSDALEVLTNALSLPVSPLLIAGGIAMSYVFGTGPAALAGLVIGLKQAFLGPATWWMALATGLLVGAAAVSGVHFQLGGLSRSDPSLTPPDLILACVVPTLLCWLLVSGWHFAPVRTEVAS